jgi:hypothetical protein
VAGSDPGKCSGSATVGKTAGKTDYDNRAGIQALITLLAYPANAEVVAAHNRQPRVTCGIDAVLEYQNLGCSSRMPSDLK